MPMTLRELVGGGAPEVEVTGLAYRSESVTPGALFFCVPGFRADGHDFAPDAVRRGAAALVCQRPLGLGAPEVVVDDVRAAMAPAAACFYGHPTRELRVVGITGTNGKTTTAFLVRHLLEAAGWQCGLLGTVKRVVGGVEEEVERTTPEAIDLQATFRRMLDRGDRASAMEVSSHALALPDPGGRAPARAAAARTVQRPERAGGGGVGARARRPARDDPPRAPDLRARAGALRAGGRGPGVRRAGRLRAHPRLARERAARRPRGGPRAGVGGVRRRR